MDQFERWMKELRLMRGQSPFRFCLVWMLATLMVVVTRPQFVMVVASVAWWFRSKA